MRVEAFLTQMRCLAIFCATVASALVLSDSPRSTARRYGFPSRECSRIPRFRALRARADPFPTSSDLRVLYALTSGLLEPTVSSPYFDLENASRMVSTLSGHAVTLHDVFALDDSPMDHSRPWDPQESFALTFEPDKCTVTHPYFDLEDAFRMVSTLSGHVATLHNVFALDYSSMDHPRPWDPQKSFALAFEPDKCTVTYPYYDVVNTSTLLSERSAFIYTRNTDLALHIRLTCDLRATRYPHNTYSLSLPPGVGDLYTRYKIWDSYHSEIPVDTISNALMTPVIPVHSILTPVGLCAGGGKNKHVRQRASLNPERTSPEPWAPHCPMKIPLELVMTKCKNLENYWTGIITYLAGSMQNIHSDLPVEGVPRMMGLVQKGPTGLDDHREIMLAPHLLGTHYNWSQVFNWNNGFKSMVRVCV